MTIHIEELTFECIIGILDFERINVQKVIVDLELDYVYQNNMFINYAEVISLIQKDMIQSEYELLESALSSLQEKILLSYSQIDKLTLKITKPTIISNAKVALSLNYKK